MPMSSGNRNREQKAQNLEMASGFQMERLRPAGAGARPKSKGPRCPRPAEGSPRRSSREQALAAARTGSPKEGAPGPGGQPGRPARISSRWCRWLERAQRPGAVPPRGGRKAGRGVAPSARLREALRAGAGRVRLPGAAGRAAFLMCHQHVEPARAARASGYPTPQLSRGLAFPLVSPLLRARPPKGKGSATAPRSPAGSARTRSPARRAQGVRNVGAQGPPRTGVRPQLAAVAPRPMAAARGPPCEGRGQWLWRGTRCCAPARRHAELSAGNRDGARSWASRTRRGIMAKFQGVKLWGSAWSGGGGRLGPCTSPTPSNAPRPRLGRARGGLEAAGRAKLRVTLCGLDSESVAGDRAGRVASPVRAAWGKASAGQSAVRRAGGWTQLEKARRGVARTRTLRMGAEGWVFAGEMRVSVQLAYKVPVLGPQDRRCLGAPRPRPASSRAHQRRRGGLDSGGAATPRVHTGERGGKARSLRALCGDSGVSPHSAEKWQRARKCLKDYIYQTDCIHQARIHFHFQMYSSNT
ncbi:translation initiation factor IF-2-like [Choloepus didactylus]|uniref:translation initiation factor IF-2-like n=1 Tax=Choloepus didactylus TaxID=27675 RepID=UPI00189E8528|nr:translation initiation factor IF-2-like [Choloepus didactylus]